MPTSFQNMATLTYTGGTVNSNIVTGELREVLTAAKTAVRENYEPGGTVTYVVSLTNSGITPLTGLTISDNLGGYTFGGATLYPLAYVPGSVRYYVNGALQAAPVVNAGPPMTVTGITVPAGGSALVIYETEVTRYAPLAAESSIVNTVTVTGGGLALREVDQHFQFKGCPGLYFVGETLDCAGSCGGYNLHWAFGSGIIAGRAAAKLRKKKK